MGQLKKNILYNFLYQILIIILPIITTPYLSRAIGAEGIGRYSYAYSIALYFTYVTMMGLNNYGNRVIATCQKDKKLRSKKFLEIYSMQLIFFLFSLSLYLLYIYFFAYEKNIALVLGIFVFSSGLDINWFFFGMEQFRLTVLRSTVIKVISVILVFVFVDDLGDVIIYAAIISLGHLLSQIILWRYIGQFIEFTKININNVIKHIKPNIVLFIPIIAVSIYKIMDKIMLGVLGTYTELGYYENAERIINVPIVLFTAIGTVMLPRITSMISEKNQSEDKYLDSTMILVLAFAIGSAFGIFAVAYDFSTVFFGVGFNKAGTIMRLLSITIVFLGFGNVVRTQILIPKSKDRVYVISAVLGAIFNLVINILLIPKLEAIGAAIGTIIAEFVVLFYQVYTQKKDIKYKEYLKQSGVFIIFGVIMIIVIKTLPARENNLGSLLLDILIGGSIYVVLSFAYISKVMNLKLNNFSMKGK